MYKTIIFILFISGGVMAQSISPTVIASSGGYNEGSGVSLSWTLGEIVTETFTNGTYTLTQGFQQPNITVAITLDINAFLEGPFNGTTMNSTLNPVYLPLNQPYHPALPYFGTTIPEWYYNGTESVAAIPNANIVDWVYVELRDASSAVTATKATMKANTAAFLLNNGKIVGLDGSSYLSFPVTITNNLYVAVWHRNHLGVLSANALTQSGGVYSYNFSTSAGQAYGGATGHKQLVAGIWGLVSGDGNGDGVVSNTDKNNVWKIQSGQSGYKAADFSMNGQVDNIDKTNKWKPNSGAGSQVPDSMTPPGGYRSAIPE